MATGSVLEALSCGAVSEVELRELTGRVRQDQNLLFECDSPPFWQSFRNVPLYIKPLWSCTNSAGFDADVQ